MFRSDSFYKIQPFEHNGKKFIAIYNGDGRIARYFGEVKNPFGAVEETKPLQKKTCACNLSVLMAFGCQCGGE